MIAMLLCRGCIGRTESIHRTCSCPRCSCTDTCSCAGLLLGTDRKTRSWISYGFAVNHSCTVAKRYRSRLENTCPSNFRLLSSVQGSAGLSCDADDMTTIVKKQTCFYVLGTRRAFAYKQSVRNATGCFVLEIQAQSDVAVCRSWPITGVP